MIVVIVPSTGTPLFCMSGSAARPTDPGGVPGGLARWVRRPIQSRSQVGRPGGSNSSVWVLLSQVGFQVGRRAMPGRKDPGGSGRWVRLAFGKGWGERSRRRGCLLRPVWDSKAPCALPRATWVALYRASNCLSHYWLRTLSMKLQKTSLSDPCCIVLRHWSECHSVSNKRHLCVCVLS